MLYGKRISVQFGGLKAVDDVSFSVSESEVLGIVGPNGSGKSTLLNALNGLVSGSGEIDMDGTRLKLGHPLESRAAGILRTFQTPQVFAELSVLENVMVSSGDRSWIGIASAILFRQRMWRHERERVDRAYEALGRVGLEGWDQRLATGLSYGTQRYVEIARALAGQGRIVLMDEPSAGLNGVETESLAKLIRELVDSQGLAVMVVDHKMDFVEKMCDRLMVLRLGSVLAEGDPSSVLRDEAVVEAYLGV